MDAATIKTRTDLRLKANPYLPQELTTKPFQYQIRMILMKLIRPRMVNGDDVGIGKTAEMIVAYTFLKAANPDTKMVVLTERSCLKQWLNEFEIFAKGIKAKIITADTHPDPNSRIQALRLGEFDVLITTYGTPYKYSQYILEGMGDRWIFCADEPNYFKNLDTMLHRNVNGMVNGGIAGKCYRADRITDPDNPGKKKVVFIDIPGVPCVRAYGLTATIIENRLEEAYGILHIIAPYCFPGRKYFDDNFCVYKKVRKGIRKVTRYKNLDRFRLEIEPYYYGRLQTDPEVEQDLPEVITKDLEIELGDEQARKLVEATDRLFEFPDGEIKKIQVLPSLILAQQMASDPRLKGFDITGAKTLALIDMLKNSLDGHRVIVFTKFREVADLLEKEFRHHNIEQPVRITGKENSDEREESKQRFMSDDPLKRSNLLLMTKAGQRGLNLQKGSVLIFFDLPWSYGQYRQIIGRLKRTGSIHTHILVIHLLGTLPRHWVEKTGMTQTIDHLTLATVKKKFQLWQIITDDVIEMDSNTADWLDIFNAIKDAKQKVAA